MTLKLVLPALLAVATGTAAPAQQGNPGGHFVENWDMDGDGTVTLAEATEKRGEIFYMFDQDENGLLDGAEYDLFDETRKADMDANAGGHKRGQMGKAHKGMMREFNDVDGDGMVSRDEFREKAAAWFALVDRNGDGVVTTDDFGRRGG